jgi:TPR repeat protein
VALGANHYSEGLEWLRKASTQEYGPALLWLGLAYVRGMGVSVDMGKGIAYLKRSADTGNFPARRELALLMIRGKLGLKRIPIGLALLPFAVISAIFDSVFKGDSDNLMG